MTVDYLLSYFQIATPYYIWTLSITFLVLFTTVLVQYVISKRQYNKVTQLMEDSNKSATKPAKQSQFKTLQDEIYANLNEEQLEEEKKAEQEQLAAIFDLLQKTEKSLNVMTTEEDFQKQLKLYR